MLLGGAAGVFVGPEALDTPLTFEATRAIGATLGSGVVMVFDETADMVGALTPDRPRSSATSRAASASRAGSGPSARRSCSPGSRRGAAAARRAATTSWPSSREIGQAMRDASICGLGQTA